MYVTLLLPSYFPSPFTAALSSRTNDWSVIQTAPPLATTNPRRFGSACWGAEAADYRPIASFPRRFDSSTSLSASAILPCEHNWGPAYNVSSNRLAIPVSISTLPACTACRAIEPVHCHPNDPAKQQHLITSLQHNQAVSLPCGQREGLRLSSPAT